MQSSLRTSRKKDLKKGRKKKTGSGGKGSKKGSNSKTKGNKKRSILKRSKSSSTLDLGKGEKVKPKKVKTATLPVEAEPKKPRKGKVPAMSKDHAQNRVVWGNSWMYEVLPNQIYGCSNCRCIWGGCKSCKKPGFRGKNAEYFRKMQQDNAGSIQIHEESGRESKAKRSKRKVTKD